jgi:DNA-binding XRE family transcriptional regulator
LKQLAGLLRGEFQSPSQRRAGFPLPGGNNNIIVPCFRREAPVSHRLVMTAQVRNWLHGLRSGDPVTRRLVAEAIDRLVVRRGHPGGGGGVRGTPGGTAMSEEPEFFTYTREEFLDEFVHPDDRPALEEARQKRVLQVRAEYLTEMRKKAGLTQAEVAGAMGVSQQRVSAIESGSVAELATLADYIRALGGELKVIADFGDSWRRVA